METIGGRLRPGQSGEIPVVCSWCTATISQGREGYEGPVSHGICPLCRGRMMGDYDFRLRHGGTDSLRRATEPRDLAEVGRGASMRQTMNEGGAVCGL